MANAERFLLSREGYFIARSLLVNTMLISSLFYPEFTGKGVLDAAFDTIHVSAGILLIAAVAA